MFIKNYGLLWHADEVEWNPGKGTRGVFRLRGRQGTNLPGLRVADFRHQQGIDLLYGNHGLHYVGLTKMQGLGKRLNQHRTDEHAHQWGRFSWFGFRRVLEGKDDDGFCKLAELAQVVVASPVSVITDIEALLHRALGPSINKSNFVAADQPWTQITAREVEQFMGKLVA
jgi:hypothetical protein